MPESYIVRIYRRQAGNPAQAVGVVITAEKGRERQQSFHDATELLDILSLRKLPPRTERKKTGARS